MVLYIDTKRTNVHAFRFLSAFRSAAEGLLNIPLRTPLVVNKNLLDNC
jgi:hypothetical protein